MTGLEKKFELEFVEIIKSECWLMALSFYFKTLLLETMPCSCNC